MKMRTILSFILVSVLSSCATHQGILRVDKGDRDAFKEESFLRYSKNRLKELMGTPSSSLALCHLGKEEKGLENLKKDFLKRKDDPDYWNQIGLCYFLKKDYKKAVFYFDLSMKTKKGKVPYLPALNNMGVVHLHLGHYQQSLNLFKRVTSYNSKLLVPRFNTSQIYLRFHRLAPAKKILEGLYRENKNDLEVIHSLGTLSLLEKNINRAYFLFHSIPKDELGRDDIALMKAITFYQQKKYKKSLSLLKDHRFGKVGNFQKSANELRSLATIALAHMKEEEKER